MPENSLAVAAGTAPIYRLGRDACIAVSLELDQANNVCTPAKRMVLGP
jgi:hypothetical protein